jgi:NhaP-type Na+/H+ or K+/H+ antiporter
MKLLRKEGRAYVGHVAPIVLFYFLLYVLGIDNPPSGPWFILSALWTLAVTGGYVSEILGLPPLVGHLIAGIALSNATASHFDLPDAWHARIRSSGLVVILLRSGLDINYEKVRRAGNVALRLTFLPALFEALLSALASVVVLNMKPLLALAQGFVLAAVSPAVVVGGMLNLRRLGYGVEKGIPSLVIAAASLDDIVAISAFSMCIGIAIRDESTNVVWLVLNMPLTALLGVGLGIIGGGLLSLTNLWMARWQRTFLLLLFGLIAMSGTKKMGFTGSGAMASIAMGAMAAYFWKGLCRKCLRKNHGGDNMVRQTAMDMDFIWTMICEPLLFSSVGTALTLQTISARTMPRSLVVIVIGLVGRTFVAYISIYGAGFTKLERCFIAFSWCPKATVQAALSFIPLAMTKELMMGRSEYQLYVKMSNQIITTAIISILVTAPIACWFIERYGPKWLEYDASRMDPSANKTNKDNLAECSAAIESLRKAKDNIHEIDDSAGMSCSIAQIRHLLLHCKQIVDHREEIKDDFEDAGSNGRSSSP